MPKFLCVFFLLAGVGFHTAHAQNPVSYENVKWSGHLAEFSFDDLGNREVVNTKKMSFFAEERVELKFRVKIRPNGTVSYVAASCAKSKDKDMYEYRRGGTSALYGYRFNEIEADAGDQWVLVTMVVAD